MQRYRTILARKAERGSWDLAAPVDPLGLKLSSSISHWESLGTNPVGRPRSGIRAATKASGSINRLKKLAL